MGGGGIDATNVDALIEGVTARENGISGIRCGRCQILRNIIYQNRLSGITTCP